MGEAKYMLGWPAGRPAGFLKKNGPRRIHPAGQPGRGRFVEKSGRPAGQPTMYLASPIHFGRIFISIGILLHDHSFIFGIFSLKQVPKIQERVFLKSHVSVFSLNSVQKIPPMIGEIYPIIYQYQ